MRETILSALPPCFEKWCQKFGVSYKFFCWLRENEEIFAQHKANLGANWG
ncbi:MAG: hypothetical protein F6K24_01590 [Okeania sp. SIO2D1]|nr:hypothetical protein [Okeania sp. SIO2D1]